MEHQTRIEQEVDQRIVLACEGKKGLIIGDPDYLDEISKCEKRGLNTLNPTELHNYQCVKDYVYKGNVGDCKMGIIAIDHIKEKWNYDYDWGKGSIDLGYYNVKMGFARAEDMARMMTLPNNHPFDPKQLHDLGCDCAEFGMYCDGKLLNYKTGSDGLYGCWGRMDDEKYPINNLFYVSLNFDDTLFKMDELKQNFEYFFEAKETTLAMDDKNPAFFQIFVNQEKGYLKSSIKSLSDIKDLSCVKGSDLYLSKVKIGGKER